MASQFAVDLIFSTKGGGKIRDLSNKLQGIEGGSKGAQRGLDGASRSMRGVDQSARTAAGGVNKLSGAVKGLLTGFAVLQGAKFVIGKTAEIETQTRSLQVLTGELGKAKEIIGDLQQFASVTPFTSSELIETAKRLKAFGVETEQLVDITKRLGDVSGATGAELAGVATAYGQIQAKGRLQGEELLQLQERGIDIAGQLKKQLGLTGEEFQSAMQKGKISSKDVERALISLTNTGGKYAKGAISQSDTLAGKFSTLQDGIDSLARRLGTVLAPALKSILSLAIRTVNAINDALSGGFATAQSVRRIGLATPGGTKGDLQGLINDAKGVTGTGLTESGLKQAADQIKRNQQLAADTAARINATRPFGTTSAENQLFESLQKESQAAIKRLDSAQKLLQQRKADQEKILTKITGPDPTDPDKGGGKSGKSAADIAKEQLKAYTDLSVQFSRQVALLKAKDETSRRLLEIDHQFADNQAQINEIQDSSRRLNLEALNADLKRLEVQNALTDAARAYNQEKLGGASYNGAEVVRLAELTESAELAAIAGQTLGDSFSSSFKSVVDGTKTAQEAIADFFRSIADALLNYASMAIAEYIRIGIARAFAGLNNLSVSGQSFGGFSGGSSFGVDATGLQGPLTPFAEGGIVRKPTAALIGEAGPEAVIPLSEMRKGGMGGGDVQIVINQTINSDGSSSTDVKTQGQKGEELGRQMSSIVKAVILHERRPGGLLSR